MKRCAACKGRIDIDKHLCMRCDMDLSLLLCIEDNSQHACHLAMKFLLKGEVEEAFFYVKKAVGLKRTPFTEALYRYTERMLRI